MLTSKRNIIIYHKNCVDGFVASYFAKLHFEKINEKCEFIPIVPNSTDILFKNPIPIDEIKSIMSFDVGYDCVTFKKLINLYPMIIIFDHHKSSYDDINNALKSEKELRLNTLDKYIFDNDECGASLSWKYFNDDEPMPLFLDLIKQRDTWTFKSKYDEISAIGLYSYIKMNDYSCFENIMTKSIEYFNEIGNIINDDNIFKNTQNYISGANKTIDGYKCYIINTTAI
jgi:hypothetical protein